MIKLFFFTFSLILFSYFIAYSQGTIAAGGHNSYYICSDGTVKACGWNFSGQNGDNTTTQRTTVVAVSGLTSVTKVAASGYHALALKSDGTVWAWGYNNNGQIGDNSTTQRNTPVQVSGLTNVTNISAGGYTSYALKSDGTVWAWGENANGEIGDNTTTDRWTPVQASGLTSVSFVSAGGSSAYALKSNGTVWAWGANNFNQIGDNTTTTRKTAVQVSGLSSVTWLSGGSSSGYVVKSDGTVWAWGANSSNELGDGTTVQRATPVQVSGITNALAVYGGIAHGLVIKSDKTGWGWGYNNKGQLGDGSTTNRSTPVAVGGSITNLSAFGFGCWAYTGIALKTDNTIKAWGRNETGELGDNTTTNRTSPISPTGLCTVTLPVELLYFNVECAKNNNQQQLVFTWATASETNNDYFTLEKDTLLPDNTVDWIEIGVVKGAGNSNETKTYEYFYTDHVELENAKKHLYRIRQTDFDGNTSVFDVNDNDCIGQNFVLNIYPVPFLSDIVVTGLPIHQTIKYEIVDVTGKTLINAEHFNLSNNMHLNLNFLEKGIYFINIYVGMKKENRKIIKVDSR